MMIRQRQAAILTSTIEHYIDTGEPVGSKSLSFIADLGVGAATIRNELAELVRLGYLHHVHTSSGRVPTHKGYRFYVNLLLASPLMATTEQDTYIAQHITSIQAKYDSLNEVLTEISYVLADIMDTTAVATIFPAQEAELSKLVAAGQSRLLKCREFMDVSRAQRVLETLEHTEQLSQHMSHWIASNRSVIIGEENQETALQDCSVVLAPLNLGEGALGGLAIVGSTRMNYRRLIPLMHHLSGLIGQHIITGRN
jgi:transcriptional regulator of heat shock response